MDQQASFRPLGARVLVAPAEPAKQIGSLVLPDNVKQNTGVIRGFVKAVGPGKMIDGVRVPPVVEVGELVILAEWGGDEIKLDGETMFIVEDADILAAGAAA